MLSGGSAVSVVALFHERAIRVDATEHATATAVIHPCTTGTHSEDTRNDVHLTVQEKGHDPDGVDAGGMDVVEELMLLYDLLNDEVIIAIEVLHDIIGY